MLKTTYYIAFELWLVDLEGGSEETNFSSRLNVVEKSKSNSMIGYLNKFYLEEGKTGIRIKQ